MTEEIRARVEACHTDDGIDHGKRHLEDCLDATIEKYADGTVYCPITWSGGTCEECMEIFERRQRWEIRERKSMHQLDTTDFLPEYVVEKSESISR